MEKLYILFLHYNFIIPSTFVLILLMHDFLKKFQENLLVYAQNRMPQPCPSGHQAQPAASMPPGQDSKLNIHIDNQFRH